MFLTEKNDGIRNTKSDKKGNDNINRVEILKVKVRNEFCFILTHFLKEVFFTPD